LPRHCVAPNWTRVLFALQHKQPNHNHMLMHGDAISLHVTSNCH